MTSKLSLKQHCTVKLQLVKELYVLHIHKLKSIYVMEQTNKCTSIIYIFISFPVVHWLLVFSSHSFQFTASLDVKFRCSIALLTSFSQISHSVDHAS